MPEPRSAACRIAGTLPKFQDSDCYQHQGCSCYPDARDMPRDDSIEDLENLPAPEVIAPEIIEELTAAFEEFAATRNPKNRPDG
jgi:hypothetical protein